MVSQSKRRTGLHVIGGFEMLTQRQLQSVADRVPHPCTAETQVQFPEAQANQGDRASKGSHGAELWLSPYHGRAHCLIC